MSNNQNINRIYVASKNGWQFVRENHTSLYDRGWADSDAMTVNLHLITVCVMSVWMLPIQKV
jgi:hypothetical protein